MKIMKVLKILAFGGASSIVGLHLRVMATLRDRGWLSLAAYVSRRLQRKHGVFISHKAHLPRSLSFRHPVGIVIGDGVTVGERVVIFQNVTLGGARLGDAAQDNYPDIGDDTVIFAGAIIVGKIRVGKNCVVGANAVVTRDIPDNSTAVGVPARIIAR